MSVVIPQDFDKWPLRLQLEWLLWAVGVDAKIVEHPVVLAWCKKHPVTLEMLGSIAGR